jgi:hypothetical protein
VVREPDATMQPAPQDMQLMSKHRVLSLKPYLRLEWRGQDGQSETEQPDHSASLGDSITSSTRIRFSVSVRTGVNFTLVSGRILVHLSIVTRTGGILLWRDMQLSFVIVVMPPNDRCRLFRRKPRSIYRTRHFR